MKMSDPWAITSRERARYTDQFKSLQPINGIVTGAQAKGLFLQSQLPPLVLGQIWYVFERLVYLCYRNLVFFGI